MLTNRTFIIVFFVALLSAACNNPKQLGSNDYIKWIDNPDNGLKKEKKLDEYQYKVFYKPADYVVFREIINSGAKSIDEQQAQKRIGELSNFHQFNFDIVSADGKVSVLQHHLSNQEEHAARVNYFVSHAQQDFLLVEGSDTMPCVLYHFEQTFGATPLNTISLGFEKKSPKTEGDLQLIFTNRLFNTGEIKFLFPKSTITNIPKLKL